MDIPSSEVIKVVYALLPGFLAAWVFYGLTAHRKLSPFERTVQALIFSGIIQAVVLIVQELLLFLGKIHYLGVWTEASSFIASFFIAFLLGLCFSIAANKNWFHRFLWEHGRLTQRTSFPSEWYSTFSQEQRYVILHLDGDRRLYGWPLEWPDHSDSGNFVMMKAAWVIEDEKLLPLTEVFKILISVKDVKMVEFLKSDEEMTAQTSSDQ